MYNCVVVYTRAFTCASVHMCVSAYAYAWICIGLCTWAHLCAHAYISTFSHDAQREGCYQLHSSRWLPLNPPFHDDCILLSITSKGDTMPRH